MNTSLGYAKKTLTNSNVLLSGGGDKALSEFIGSLNWDSTNRKLQYKSASSTNFTDLITFGSNAFTSYSGYDIVFQNNEGTTVDTFKALTSPSKTFKAGTNVQMTADSNVITITATDTWNANALGVAGYVAAPTKADNANMTWQTDAEGVPAWRTSNNHSHSYLPLAGGTMTGQLKINYGIATDEWASYNGAISIRNTSNDNPYTLGLAANNGGYGEIQASQIGIDAVNLVLQKKGGNVGIGKTSPNYKLDISGDIYSSGYIRTGSGFIKRNLSDSYVLLAGGGHASLTNLQVSGTATSVTSLNVEKTFIYATLTESATLGLSNSMSTGQVLTILAFNNSSASITLTVPSAWKSLDGYSINIGAQRFGEISILCYASGSFMVSSKVQ